MRVAVLLSLAIINAGCSGSMEENRLLADLLIGYNKIARPVLNPTKAVHLKLGVSLREAVNLDEDQGQVTVTAWIRMVWNDEYLKWDPSQFGGIERVYLSPDRIWTPDITLYNALHSEPNGESQQPKLSVTYDGHVTWTRPMTYTVTCTHQFRGNAWHCPLTFGSWVYDARKLEIHGDRKKVDLNDDDFLPSDRFILLGHEGKREIVKYKCCGGSFTIVKYLLKLRSKIGTAFLGRK